MTPEEIAFCDQVIVAGPNPVKYHSFELAEQIIRDGIPGDFVECGTMAGGHPAIWAYVFRKHRVQDRLIHVFDSFQGIPKASEEDGAGVIGTYGLRTPGIMESSGISKVDVPGFWYFMDMWGADRSLIKIHPGWFQETMAVEAAAIHEIALLRVDVDLYESTIYCYQNMYAKVVPGGFVEDDDWGRLGGEAPPCRRACLSVFAANQWPEPTMRYEVQGCETTVGWRK